MKKETILSRLAKGGFLRKDGEIKTRVKNLSWHLEMLSNGLKIHPLSWGSGWASLEGEAKFDLVCQLLDSLKIQFVTGNDSPRGGVTGRFVALKDKAACRKLLEVLNLKFK